MVFNKEKISACFISNGNCTSVISADCNFEHQKEQICINDRKEYVHKIVTYVVTISRKFKDRMIRNLTFNVLQMFSNWMTLTSRVNEEVVIKKDRKTIIQFLTILELNLRNRIPK